MRDKQHIIDKKHGIIDIIIIIKGDISNIVLLSSFVQLHNELLSSIISVIFIYK